MKYLSEYLLALALAFGTLVFASMDVHAAVVCGPNGCHHYYPHRSQWPVGGAYHPHRRSPQASNPPAATCPFCASTFRH
jgi:hypothetical protein